MKTSFQEQYSIFSDKIEEFTDDSIYPHAIESFFESLNDWSQFHSIEEVKKWFLDKRKFSSLSIKEIPLNAMKEWETDPVTGNISHCSGDFFIIHGLRVNSKNREVDITWEQPILEQVGYDGGLLGIIKKRFNGAPHYLCEAKEEPGNYGKVQISPSLQATFANLNQIHGGRKPYFSDLFISRSENKNINILFDSWLAEDGGRLHLKRNRGVLLEVNEYEKIYLPNDNFIWLSLYQIKHLLKEDAWINPHVRGIIAHV